MLGKASLHAGIFALAVLSSLGCETIDFRRGGNGESCGRTDDCEAPLVSVAQVCVPPAGTGGSIATGGSTSSGGGGATSSGGGGTTSMGGSTSSGGGGSTSTGGTTSSGGAGGEILDPVLCHQCLDDQCGTPLAACGADCRELEACIETLCSHLSELVSPEEGACQVHCQQLHIGSKAAHLAVVNCALSSSCKPCSSYPWDYNHCQASATLPPGVCAPQYEACNADPDCISYRSCVATCDTLDDCLACQTAAAATQAGALLEEYEYCIATQCLAESWLL